MEPVFRDGDMVVVSPSAPIRRGDRVVVRTVRGEAMAKQLVRQSARRIELRSLNPEHPDYTFHLSEVAWMHRIIWGQPVACRAWRGGGSNGSGTAKLSHADTFGLAPKQHQHDDQHCSTSCNAHQRPAVIVAERVGHAALERQG